jgi:hypothetical protein
MKIQIQDDIIEDLFMAVAPSIFEKRLSRQSGFNPSRQKLKACKSIAIGKSFRRIQQRNIPQLENGFSNSRQTFKK